MLLDALHIQREAIHAACRQYGARRIRVFGSVARGEERPDSDIDFLVDFPRGYDFRSPNGWPKSPAAASISFLNMNSIATCATPC